jgi:hypothetical protein
VNWKCNTFSYDELLATWNEVIGTPITPGHLRRYHKAAASSGLSLEEVRIGYKYCAAGKLSRFYLMKGAHDTRPPRAVLSCSQFTADPAGSFAAIWRICSEETHGPSEYRGIRFVPGLFEHKTYTRIPLYGSVRPRVERSAERCNTCGGQAKRVLVVELRKVFCCNEHYLAWWAKRYREEYQRLAE